MHIIKQLNIDCLNNIIFINIINYCLSLTVLDKK